jgi:uncharacterized glyoxalase superfamily protein PhnB
MPVKPIPDGFHAVTPSLVVRGAPKAIDFYRRAFGAEEIMRMPAPDGRIMHAEIRIGDSIVFINDEFPEWGSRSPEAIGGTASTLHVYVSDVDAVFERAVAAGAKAVMPPADMFWGDRAARITDPFGHAWGIGTRKEDLSPEEIAERGQAWMASQKK